MLRQYVVILQHQIMRASNTDALSVVWHHIPTLQISFDAMSVMSAACRTCRHGNNNKCSVAAVETSSFGSVFAQTQLGKCEPQKNSGLGEVKR